MREQTMGRCELCGKAFGKAGMARHIPACRRHKPPETGPDALLLQVEGRGLPDYWLFLEVAPTATWSHLDAFFRDTWVECCGHLSSFEAGGTTYVDDPVEAREWTDNARSLTGRIGRSLAPGGRFLYTYDFGTSTELVGRALASVPALRAAPRYRFWRATTRPTDPARHAVRQPPGSAGSATRRRSETAGTVKDARASTSAATPVPTTSCPWSTRRALASAPIRDRKASDASPPAWHPSFRHRARSANRHGVARPWTRTTPMSYGTWSVPLRSWRSKESWPMVATSSRSGTDMLGLTARLGGPPCPFPGSGRLRPQHSESDVVLR